MSGLLVIFVDVYFIVACRIQLTLLQLISDCNSVDCTRWIIYRRQLVSIQFCFHNVIMCLLCATVFKIPQCHISIHYYFEHCVCSGGYFMKLAAPGNESDPIWLDQVICTGEESTLAHCDHDVWGQHDCSHSEDLAVFCCK